MASDNFAVLFLETRTQVYMDGPTSHPPVCADVVKDGNYAATLSLEVAVSEGKMTEEAMARWLILNGPLSVALDASGMDYYSGGIDMGEVTIDNRHSSYCTQKVKPYPKGLFGFSSFVKDT